MSHSGNKMRCRGKNPENSSQTPTDLLRRQEDYKDYVDLMMLVCSFFVRFMNDYLSEPPMKVRHSICRKVVRFTKYLNFGQ